MGLDTSHDAFHGAYSAFNRLRQCVAAAIGGSYPEHYVYGARGVPLPRRPGEPHLSQFARKPDMDESRWYWPDKGYSRKTHPGLYEFFTHSDCDGVISPEMCSKVADELEAVLPAIVAMDWEASGHIERDGGFEAVVRRFIQGCRDAASAGEELEFR